MDADLGLLRVFRVVGAFGAGMILNARNARSQFLGGMVWGVSLALYEDGVLDPRLGRFVTNNLAEYQISTGADILEIEALWWMRSIRA